MPNCGTVIILIDRTVKINAVHENVGQNSTTIPANRKPNKRQTPEGGSRSNCEFTVMRQWPKSKTKQVRVVCRVYCMAICLEIHKARRKTEQQ